MAHWFYLDFYCEEVPELKPCGIKDFSTQLFIHCPFLSQHAGQVDKILEDWKLYKMSVPTYGAIMLDPTLTYVLLLHGYRTKASWGFPKGKVNENEGRVACAIREVYEETGYQLTENDIHEDDYIEAHRHQLTRLYVVPNVPMDTVFQPQTRNEIKHWRWFPVEHLPAHPHDKACHALYRSANHFFMVIPFVKELRNWIKARKESCNIPEISSQNAKLIAESRTVDNTDISHTPHNGTDQGNKVQNTENNNKKKTRKHKKSESDAKKAENMRQKFAQANRNELNALLGVTTALVSAPTLSDAPGQYPWPKKITHSQLPANDFLNTQGDVEEYDHGLGENNQEDDCGYPVFCSQAWLNFKFDVPAIMSAFI